MLEDTFANRLRKAMEQQNIKSIELSEKTGISKSQISHWLAGRYKAKQDSLSILAEYLNVEEAWLMGFNVPQYKNDNIIENKKNVLLDNMIKKLSNIDNETLIKIDKMITLFIENDTKKE